MLASTVFMASLAAVLLAVGWMRGQNQHVQGARTAAAMLVEVLPMLAVAFLVAGMVQALLPREVVARWVGREAGLRGVLIGTLAGMLAPGGPFVSFPLVAGFLQAGASIGTAVAFLTAWSLLALSRLPLEVGILGWKFVIIRTATTLVFPVVAGFLSQTLFSRWWGAS